ncbi:MAG: hypothetical protein ACREBU_03040 [Nitrososphaera sp.]
MISKAEIKRHNIYYILDNQEEQLDSKYYKLVADVLYKFPYNVVNRLSVISPQIFVIEKGSFADSFILKQMKMKSSRGTPIEEDEMFEKTWLILVNDELMDKCTLSEKHSIIAEELAHAYAGHNARKGDNDDSSRVTDNYREQEEEMEAANLIKKWGFEPKDPVKILKRINKKVSRI